MWSDLKNKFQNMNPDQQKKLVQVGAAIGFIIIAMIAYKVSGKGKKQPTEQTKAEKGFREMTPSLHTLQRNLYLESKEKLALLEKQLVLMGKNIKKLQDRQDGEQGKMDEATKMELDGLKKELTEARQELQKQIDTKAATATAPSTTPAPGAAEGGLPSPQWTPPEAPGGKSGSSKPPAPGAPGSAKAGTILAKGGAQSPEAGGQAAAGHKSGSISHFSSGTSSSGKDKKKGSDGSAVTNSSAGDKTGQATAAGQQAPGPGKDAQKESGKQQTVYLPSGTILKADLLSGFAAKTMQKGNSEPIKALFRVNAPAVLPSNYSSDLETCVVISEGTADLASERTHLRLLQLSCISRDGSSVIDSPIVGYAVDADGRIGLRGNVSAKFSPLVARALLIGMLEGIGEGIGQSGYTQTSTLLGTTNTFNPDVGNMAKVGIGKGMQNTASDVKDLFMQLAQETMPVIESGSGKRAHLVITQGANLAIKPQCFDGRDGCKKTEDKKSESINPLAGL